MLAAVSNPAYTSGVGGGGNIPESFAFDDGTSMAAPHVSGAAALLKSLHPAWTPAELNSALSLTAVTALTDQCANVVAGVCTPGSAFSPFVRGSGRIDALAAEHGGLLLDESGMDYNAANPASGGDLTTLNLAGLGNEACAGTCNWTRTFTSAFASTTAHYTVAVSGQSAGVQVTVTPSSFDLGPGATQHLAISADVTGAALANWAYAQVDITSNGNGDDGQPIAAAHMPLAVLVQSAPPLPPPPPKSTGGGSFDWLVIGVLVLTLCRRCLGSA